MSTSIRRAAAAAGVVALTAAAFAPAAAQAATPSPVPLCASVPFRSDAATSTWYRIPAVVRTNAGTLLAFAERRDSSASSSDTGDTSIVLARSTDAGCHWAAPVVVADHGTDTVGNPAPVVDTATGDVLLLSVDRPRGGTSYHGLHVQRSTDDGLTFTPYADSGNDLAGLPNWAGGLTGPGHGIQLADGDLVVPIGFQRGSEHGVYTIVSADGGVTWDLGFEAIGSTPTQEGSIAQLPDGRIWLTDRNPSSSTPVGQGRFSAFGSADASTLMTPAAHLPLPLIAVQGSTLELTGTHAGTLLLSSPGTPDPSTRRVMTVYTAKTQVPGSSWYRYPVTLDDTQASYSDLVQLDDATIGILYETGADSWHDHVSFHAIRISALTAGATVSAKVGSSVPVRTAASGTAHITATVTVSGTSAPAGNVTVKVSKKGWSKSVTLALRANNGGRRVASITSIPKGTYTVHVTYSGTPRIKPATAADRTMRVG